MSDSIHITLGDDFVAPESDIVIKIDFKEGDGSAARVFDIAANMIRAFEDLDRVLIGSIDSRIQTALIVEDLEKSSIKIFLRNLLKATDDQAIKELDWKPAVGKYLVKGKYAALEWLDQKIADDEPAGIEDLTERMRSLAAETDVRHLPDYPRLNPARIAQPLDEIQRTKAMFRPGEKLTVTLGKEEYSVDIGSTWLPSDHMDEVNAERELANDIDMVLVIRKPDFLGNSQWQFRHGKKTFSAPIHDEKWIRDFHMGNHPLKPGDALRVRVRYEYKYDAKGNLMSSEEKILKVFSVTHAASPPDDLFRDR